MRRAFSLYSLSIRSIVASAAARQTGFPPNVVPCEPGPQRITLSLAMIAPSGMPLAMPLAVSVQVSNVLDAAEKRTKPFALRRLRRRQRQRDNRPAMEATVKCNHFVALRGIPR